MKELNEGNCILTPWCVEEECEKKVKTRSSQESKLMDETSETGEI